MKHLLPIIISLLFLFTSCNRLEGVWISQTDNKSEQSCLIFKGDSCWEYTIKRDSFSTTYHILEEATYTTYERRLLERQGFSDCYIIVDTTHTETYCDAGLPIYNRYYFSDGDLIIEDKTQSFILETCYKKSSEDNETVLRIINECKEQKTN